MTNRKFDQLSKKLKEKDTRVSETKTPAESNTSRVEPLEADSKITNSKLEEYFIKIEQLKELIDDKITKRS